MRKLIGVCFISIFFFHANGQDDPRELFDKTFSPAQLHDDFSLFRQSLEKLHPGLYRYTTRREMDSIFNAALERLGKPMHYKDFYKLLALVNAQIRCQHTAVAPGQRDYERISKYAKMFPYEIMWDFDPVKAYAFSDVTNEGGIKPATEILRINGNTCLPMGIISPVSKPDLYPLIFNTGIISSLTGRILLKWNF